MIRLRDFSQCVKIIFLRLTYPLSNVTHRERLRARNDWWFHIPNNNMKVAYSEVPCCIGCREYDIRIPYREGVAKVGRAEHDGRGGGVVWRRQRYDIVRHNYNRPCYLQRLKITEREGKMMNFKIKTHLELYFC
jgi:hypothetical protein